MYFRAVQYINRNLKGRLLNKELMWAIKEKNLIRSSYEQAILITWKNILLSNFLILVYVTYYRIITDVEKS